jgi:transposase|tara:strand:+ start:76 stop:501 length:426 start_codon:yes stop_codon:yes gene_type:complete
MNKEADMSHSFSADLRWRVITAISGGLSTRKAARRFSIGVSTAGEWYRRYRDHGETMARKQGQPGGSKLDAHEAFIFGLVEETPDMALHEIVERLAAESRVSACPATVWRFFDKRGITFKKNGARGGTRTRRRGAHAPLLA